MKKILIADDDPVLRGMLSRMLTSGSDRFEVISATDEDEALKILSRHNVNLVITDFHFSGSDGFHFLSFIRGNYKETPVFVTTAFGTPEIKKTVENIEMCRYFEKPLNVKVFTKAVFNVLGPSADRLAETISLPSFLGQISKEIKTCTLVIDSADKKGELFFLNGDLISAKTGALKNKEAATEIISWKKSNIEIHNAVPQTTRVIDEPPADVTKTIPPEKSDKPDESENQVYSEHYSRTQKFIHIIDEIQTAVGMEKTWKSNIDTAEEHFNENNPAMDSKRYMVPGNMAKELKELQKTLTEVIGPIAKIIFIDSVKEWIATDQPAPSTIPNLMDILSREINDPEKFNIYRRQIPQNIGFAT